MARAFKVAAGTVLVVGTALLPSYGSAAAQTRSCLHEAATETESEQARRGLALRLARAINTAEMQVFSTQKKFTAIEQLPISAGVPQGFVAALSTDSQSYAFSIKDTIDPCRFAYFSDQNGVIFNGQPIR
jgi:hypothetical protein